MVLAVIDDSGNGPLRRGRTRWLAATPDRLPKTLLAGRRRRRGAIEQVLRSRMRTRLAIASATAMVWLDDQALFLDTETTGLGDHDQIIELTICDGAGTVVFNSRIRPTVPIQPQAQAVHGISQADLADAPAWSQVAGQIEAVLSGRPVVAFCADYDWRLLRQTGLAHGLDPSWMDTCQVRCAQKLAVAAFGATSATGRIRLTEATRLAGVTWRGQPHTSLADTLALVDLVQALAKVRRDLEHKLAAL